MGLWEQTWIKKYNGFQTSVLVVIDLDFLKGLDQLVQDPVGHAADLDLTAVALNNVVVSWGGKIIKSSCPQFIRHCLNFYKPIV